jgi:hypothetical protein
MLPELRLHLTYLPNNLEKNAAFIAGATTPSAPRAIVPRGFVSSEKLGLSVVRLRFSDLRGCFSSVPKTL